MTYRCLLAVTLLALVPGVARADDARFASGGPKAPAQRDAALAAVASAQADMGPCWRRAQAPVEIAISVGGDGAVTSARAKTAGPAAQCVAGLLAVATMPATGAGWSGVVVVPPRAAGGGSLEGEITHQLGERRAALAGCQSADPASVGQVTLALAIAPSGAIAPSIAASTVSKPIEGCLLGALRGVTLSLPERKAVRYQLNLAFAGESTTTRPAPRVGGGAARPPAPADPADAPSIKAGATLEAAAIHSVIAAARADLERCGGASASGKVTVGFTIRSDGSVKNVAVKSSTTGNAKLDACVAGRFEKLRFPASAGESRVNFPLVFGK